MENLPIACTLNREELAARKSGLLAEIAALSLKQTRAPTVYRLEFEATSDVLTRIVAMLDAERQCCRFLRFRLTVEPNLGPIVLELSGPPGTEEFLASLLDPDPNR
jgi:hypothetical protein